MAQNNMITALYVYLYMVNRIIFIMSLWISRWHTNICQMHKIMRKWQILGSSQETNTFILSTCSCSFPAMDAFLTFYHSREWFPKPSHLYCSRKCVLTSQVILFPLTFMFPLVSLSCMSWNKTCLVIGSALSDSVISRAKPCLKMPWDSYS